jgi:hypothetical protein
MRAVSRPGAAYSMAVMSRRAVRYAGGAGGTLMAFALPEAIAVAVHFQDVDVVRQPVEQRTGESFRSGGGDRDPGSAAASQSCRDHPRRQLPAPREAARGSGHAEPIRGCAMTPACPGGSTGRSRAPPRVPLESASLRAGPTYGLPGQASARAKQRPIITDKVAQALVAPVDQFLDVLETGPTIGQ